MLKICQEFVTFVLLFCYSANTSNKSNKLLKAIEYGRDQRTDPNQAEEIGEWKLSLYLDIYINGKREYEFIKLYLIPEKTKTDKEVPAFAACD